MSKFNSIIGDFNYRYWLSASFISIFCYRRLIEVLLILFMDSYPYAQVQFMTLSCIFVVILFGYSNTYRMSSARRLEFFNEATIMLCCYHLFLFTDYIDDPELRYTIGFSLIVCTVSNIAVNMALMLFETLKKIFNKIFKFYRKCMYERRFKKFIKNRAKRALEALEYK